MSTSYYRLREPFTSLRAETNGEHTKLTVWTNHACAGTLTFRNDEVRVVLLGFCEHEEDMQCPLRTHWGGADLGAVVTVNDPNMANDMCVISEYGDLLTVAEVKARDGAKRADGYPTELFGYQK